MEKLLFLQLASPSICAYDLQSGETKTLIEDFGGIPDGIQADYDKKRLYWTNMGAWKGSEADFWADDGVIQTASAEGGSRRILFGNGALTTPKQLVLDKKNERLYWCDREGAKIMSGRTDGTELRCLVDRTAAAGGRANILNHCVGIAVDYAAQKLIWTQKGSSKGGKGRIFRANIELPAGETAANRADIELLMDNLPEPIDLEMDAETDLLYWTDRGAQPWGNSLNVGRLTPAGLTDLRVICTGFSEAIGLAVDKAANMVYVADLSGKIRQVDLQSGRKKSIYNHGAITGLTLYKA